MWSKNLQQAQTKVLWLQCSQLEEHGEIDMINPIDALVFLMAKWILKACESWMSNLHAMLRFRLINFQPYVRGRWAPSLEFFTMPHCQVKRGSKAWTQTNIAWLELVKSLQPVQPWIAEEVLSEPF